MAPVAVDLERRLSHRRSGGGPQWQSRALLRPGQFVTLINISSRAALVESSARLRPGAQTELQLTGTMARTSIKGRLDRCYVAALDPLRYRGVILFEQCLALGDEGTAVGE
jgi:hypothetical protein